VPITHADGARIDAAVPSFVTMSTLTETQPDKRISHARAYLAGTGATGALIAGAALVLLSLAAFVAFKGMPFGGSGSSSGSAYVGAEASGPAATAATALAGAPGAVAAAPVPGAPVGAAFGGSGPGGAGPTGGGPNTPTDTTVTVPPPGGDTGPGPGTTTEEPGVLTNTVDQVDRALCDQGACTGVSNQTDSVTAPADQTATNALNQVGGAAGNNHLGDDVNRTVNDAVNGVLGGGGN
jgi:hypothetical protein